ncbi:unnamed protein product [Pedinophyceae sp. YPF-701]|nr:unnamed protein product [Pedinophyceae sp. YPF-701]
MRGAKGYVRQQLAKARGDGELPDDRLTPQDGVIRPRVLARNGIPETADGVAYLSTQKLAVCSCADGWMKVVGRDGVEATLPCPSGPGATSHLLAVPGRSLVLRVTKLNQVELWSLEAESAHAGPRSSAPLQVTPPGGGTITAACALPGADFAALGSSDGSVLVLRTTAPAPGGPTEPSLRLCPLTIGPRDGGPDGPVAALAAQPGATFARLLIARAAGACVWDWFERKACATAAYSRSPGTAADMAAATAAGTILSACWASQAGELFATGHASGAVLLWRIPASAGPGFAPARSPPPCSLERKVSFAADPRGGLAPVTWLGYVGGPFATLVARGGHPAGQPECLVVAPSCGEGEPGEVAPPLPASLPWMGDLRGLDLILPSGCFHVYQGGSLGALALAEGGQLLAYDFSDPQGAPALLSLSLQSRPPVTAAVLATTPPLLLNPESPVWPGGAPQNAADMLDTSDIEDAFPGLAAAVEVGDVCRAGRQSVALDGRGGSGLLRRESLLQGGLPASEEDCDAEGVPECLYVTGHRDGVVRAWDARKQALAQAMALAPPEMPGRRAAGPVSAVDACLMSGLIAAGHDSGCVSVFQWHGKREGFACVAATAPLEGDGSAVTAVTVASALGMVVAGQRSGRVTAHDVVGSCAPVWTVWQGHGSVCGLCVTPAIVPAGGRENGDDGGRRGVVRHPVAVVLTQGSGVGVLDMDTGAQVGAWCKPKNASTAVGMAGLDADGGVLGALAAPPEVMRCLEWQAAAAATVVSEACDAAVADVGAAVLKQPFRQSAGAGVVSGGELSGDEDDGSSASGDESDDDDELLAEAVEAVEAVEAEAMEDMKRRKKARRRQKVQELSGAVLKHASSNIKAAARGLGRGIELVVDPIQRGIRAVGAKENAPGAGGPSAGAAPLASDASALMGAPATRVAAATGDVGPCVWDGTPRWGAVGPGCVAPAAATSGLLPQLDPLQPASTRLAAAEALLAFPTCQYVAAVSDSAVRVYATLGVVRGHRGALAKAYVDPPCEGARAVATARGPALLCFSSRSADATAYALPGLTQLHSGALSGGRSRDAWGARGGTAAVAPDASHGILLDRGGGALRVEVLAAPRTRLPPPQQLVDPEIATAVEAAMAAQLDTTAVAPAPAPQPATTTGRWFGRVFSGAAAPERAPARSAADLDALLTRAGAGPLAASASTQRRWEEDAEWDQVGLRHRPKISFFDGGPRQEALDFAAAVDEDGIIEDDGGSDVEPAASASDRDDSPPPGDARPASSSSRRNLVSRSKAGAGAAGRFLKRLIPAGGSGAAGVGGREASRASAEAGAVRGNGPVRARTVDEIRAKYGHAARGGEGGALAGQQSAVAQTRAVMEQNVAAAQERGERLGRLQQRTAEMHEDAQSFADLASQLERKMRRGGLW